MRGVIPVLARIFAALPADGAAPIGQPQPQTHHDSACHIQHTCRPQTDSTSLCHTGRGR
jgi:hypothetical protein